MCPLCTGTDGVSKLCLTCRYLCESSQTRYSWSEQVKECCGCCGNTPTRGPRVLTDAVGYQADSQPNRRTHSSFISHLILRFQSRNSQIVCQFRYMKRQNPFLISTGHRFVICSTSKSRKTTRFYLGCRGMTSNGYEIKTVVPKVDQRKSKTLPLSRGRTIWSQGEGIIVCD
jgi:hypothetical protein